LQVIFAVQSSRETTLYVGQQLDVFVEVSGHGDDSRSPALRAMAHN